MPYRHRLWIAATLGIAVLVSAALVRVAPRVSAGSTAGTPAVSGVALVNGATRRPVLGLSPLTDGTVIDLTRLPGRDLGLRANAPGPATFTLTGANGGGFTRTAPDGYVDCPLLDTPDAYTLTVRAGTGAPYTVHFTVTGTAAAAPPVDVLFVGNSLLGTVNRGSGEDAPALVRHLACAAGRALNVTEVIHSGYTLRQTWDDGLVATVLSGATRFDFIVLQEYSTLVATNPSAATDTLLRTYAPTFARALKPGGRVVLFKNWALVDPSPFPSRAAAKAAIDTNYAALSAALPTPNLLAPIGDEFETIIAAEGPSSLIVADGKHPNDAAVYLDAVTLYGILLRESPRHLPDLYLPAPVASKLRSVAATAIGY
ncbi:hypothetical protein [Dactylosporangium sp. CA-233914]|uniref:hypothetical protein n=1 Tax=Dactylosporangium sp. CA-233914 TaxID=3239934 RepID=UPI003D8C4F20